MRRLFLILALWCGYTLWAATPYLVHHYGTEDGLSQSTVSCILQDSQGYMWFGTWDGLNRFDGSHFVTYRSNPADGLSGYNNRIINLWEKDGIVYTQTYDNCCYQVQEGELVPVTAPITLPPTTDSIYVDKHGIIWRVDDEEGISRCRNGQWRRFHPETDSRYAGQLRKNMLALEDKEGNLWINPTGGGFSRYNAEEDCLEWPFPKLTNMIHTAYIDRQGLLWLSTYDGGVDCVDLSVQPFHTVDLCTPSNPVGEVRAMMVEGDEVRIYQRDRRMVYCAIPSRWGTLLGTKGYGVIGLPYKVKCNDVYSLLEVGTTLYIATYGEGVIEVREDRSTITHGTGLKVRDLLWSDSTLFAATTSGLLVGDSLIPYYDVRCLLQDRRGVVWVGTFGGGLHHLGKRADGYHLIPHVTASNIVLAMVEDQDGNIWFTGENDITCYQPQQNTYQHYDVLNGARDAYFNETKAVRVGEELLFGYSRGYCRFLPHTIQQSNFVPPLVITKVSHSGSAAVTLSFAALDYVAPRKILYTWKLSGVDEDWVPGTTENKAHYTNLKPGKYIFTVRSTNSEGVWTDNAQQVTISIARPIWRSWWLVMIIIALVVLVVWLIWRFLKATNDLRQKVEIEQKVTDIKLRFFTNISHELRTPLTLISGPVDNLLSSEKLTSSVREQLEIVSGNAGRMLRMVNMLLDFRKMQQNQLRLKVRPVHFWNLIEDTCSNFNKEAQTKHLTFHKQLLAQDDLVWVDRDKMDTVLFNLLSNAFKYTDEGGTITVRLDEKEDYLLLSVQDTGVGIPKDKRSVLFERFRSNNELNNKATGTGIGLNLTKELVDMHHGYIEVESEVGKGSTFTVLIRRGNEHYGSDVEIVVDDTVPAVDKTHHVDHHWFVIESKPTMLIVDDNADMRAFISSIFAEHFTIQTAPDGLAALEIISKNSPEIVICDWMMPTMDGLELLRRLRQSDANASLPFILLTAKTTIENQLEGLEHGADDYISKPFSPAFIKARVQNILRQREKLQQHYHAQLISMDTHKNEKTPDEMFLARLMAFMDQQMDNNNLTVDDLVDNMNMGRTVFFNRLKSLTGLSPVEFIREVRIKRAVQLLDMNSYNVTEITYMVGMSDSRYFSKCFKQVMGMTPSEYKRQHRQTNLK